MELVVSKLQMKKTVNGIFSSVLRNGLGIFYPVRMKEAEPNFTAIEGIEVIFPDALRLLSFPK